MTNLKSSAPATNIPEPRARFRDVLAAEWIKLWSLRSTRWTLPLVTLFVIGVSANASLADYNNWPTYSAARQTLFNPLRDAFPEAAYIFLMLAASSISAMTIVGEYSSGLIRTTFAAVPARRSVVTAKVAVVAAVMLVLGPVTAATSFGVSQAILSGRHAGYSIGYPGAARAVAATALLAPVCALIGMGIGALIRHTATTIVTTTAILLLLPRLFDTNKHRWAAETHNAMPFTAWERLIQIHPDPFHPDRYPATITGSWIVLAAWPLAAAIVAVIVVHRRDL